MKREGGIPLLKTRLKVRSFFKEYVANCLKDVNIDNQNGCTVLDIRRLKEVVNEILEESGCRQNVRFLLCGKKITLDFTGGAIFWAENIANRGGYEGQRQFRYYGNRMVGEFDIAQLRALVSKALGRNCISFTNLEAEALLGITKPDEVQISRGLISRKEVETADLKNVGRTVVSGKNKYKITGVGLSGNYTAVPNKESCLLPRSFSPHEAHKNFEI